MDSTNIVKSILEAIGQRHELNPPADTFEFELGGLGVPINNENDYRIVADALEGLQTKGLIKYEIGRSGTLYESFKCKITIADKKKFEAEYEQSRSLPTAPSTPVEFDDNEAVLVYGSKRCQLPPFKNEHYFCRAVFEYPINEPVDWSLIFEKMTGHLKGEEDLPKNGWRKVYDTMEAINKRAGDVLGLPNLFVWREKTITRTQ
jgi:hypothetical protein